MEASEACLKVGYFDWDSYLKSKLFQNITKAIHIRDRHSCRICGRVPCTIIFYSYSPEILEGKYPSQIISICKKCTPLFPPENKAEEHKKVFKKEVIKVHLSPGKSEPRMGRWFKNQHQVNKLFLPSTYPYQG